MTAKPYNRCHLEALLEPCREDDRWTIDDKGVWPRFDRGNARRLGLMAEHRVLNWRPAAELQNEPGAPEAADTPALPFPFDARDLAAFFLAGAGALVAEFYGEWDDGPDEDALAEIDEDRPLARRAVGEAFVAYREAKKAIECPDDEWPETAAMVRQLLGAATAPQQEQEDGRGVPQTASPAVEEALPETKAKPRTWRDVSSAYIVEVMQAGQYATCKELYRALEAKAGPNAPFDKGTGANRGSLFVREIAQSLSLKTVQNHWRALQELAKE